MRGQRARAAVVERLAGWSGELPSDARAVIERIGDDPTEWAAIAEDVSAIGEDRLSRAALDAIAALMRFALQTTSPHHPARDRYLRSYCTALTLLAERFGDLGVVAEAEKALLPEIERRSATDAVRHQICYGIGRMAVAHAGRAPGADATRAVIRARLRLLAGMPPGDPGRPEMMSRLGADYHDLFHHESGRDAAAESVRWTRAALDEAPANHPFLGPILHSAAVALRHQCELTPDRDLAREGVRLIRAAALHRPEQDMRSDTAQALFLLHNASGDAAALDESIDLFRGWIEVTTDTTAAGMAHARLGNALRSRYQLIGVSDDLADAVRALRYATETVPPDHPSYQTALSNYSGVLAMAARHEQDDSVHGAAVRIERPLAEAGNLLALNNLGTDLTSRYLRTGDSRALREAIDTLERVVGATPRGDRYLPSRLGNLGSALYYSFLHARDLAELDRAIDLSRQAIAAGTEHERAGAGYLSQLSVRLHERHRHTPDLAVLTEAATTARDAVAAMGASDRDRSIVVSAAIDVLRTLYLATGNSPAILHEAIGLGRAELAALPTGHSGRGELLTAHATVLQQRYFDLGDRAAGRAARSALLDASRAPGFLTNQIRCAQMAALLAVSEREWADATDAFAHAITLLPRLAARQLVRADQERQLGLATGIVHDACACALNAGDPERALTLLEHGRGILFAQALENRDDLAELRERHPDLADQVDAIRAGLADGSTGVDEQHALAVRWDRLTADIRTRPGFAHFLLPPPAADLRAAAVAGPVVLFSISQFRSDALILTTGGVDVVALPDVTPDEIRRRVLAFQTEEDAVAPTLDWLGDQVTGPVLDRMGLHGPTGDTWQRVWWCPTGPLSFLPVHAAALDRVVSSYTPTVRALLHARRGRTLDADVRALVVAMASTEGADNLPGVTREVEIVAARLPHRPTVLGAADAVRDRVLAELPRHGWVHFACHAVSDPHDPSASHLVLADHGTTPLTVLDIARLRLDGADLACLSACSTAQVGATLPDEAIHLAAAFHLAGYRHVIATLWPVVDRPATLFTQRVYGMITERGSASAAYAVHTATREARRRYPRHPRAWAAHIHTGA